MSLHTMELAAPFSKLLTRADTPPPLAVSSLLSLPEFAAHVHGAASERGDPALEHSLSRLLHALLERTSPGQLAPTDLQLLAAEAKLCAELGVPYAALLIATNWAAGRHPGDATKALSHDEVSAESSKRTATITTCIVDLFKNAQA